MRYAWRLVSNLFISLHIPSNLFDKNIIPLPIASQKLLIFPGKEGAIGLKGDQLRRLRHSRSGPVRQRSRRNDSQPNHQQTPHRRLPTARMPKSPPRQGKSPQPAAAEQQPVPEGEAVKPDQNRLKHGQYLQITWMYVLEYFNWASAMILIHSYPFFAIVSF